jgi:hypothetical protein
MTDALTTVGHWCRFDEQFKLHVQRDPTQEELDIEILFLWRVREACPMSIAKLIILGEKLFGANYAPAQLATGRAYDTIAGWCRVYRQVPQDIWRDELPYSYHKAVAYRELPIETKDEYLGRAVVGEFETAADLNETVRLEQGLMEQPALLETCCPLCESPLDERNCNRRCSVCGAKPVEWARAYWQLKENGDSSAALSRAHTKTDIEQET